MSVPVVINAATAAVGVVAACVAVGRVRVGRARASAAMRPMERGRRWRLPVRTPLAAAAAAVVTAVIAPALVPAVATAVLVAPRVHRRWRMEREWRVGEAELPDTLESVARALRAGASLAQAVAETPAPCAPAVRDEWLRLQAAVPVAGVAGAVDGVWSRPAATAGGLAPARQLVGAALRLAADVGGPQARALDLAAATLRQRVATAGEAWAQSAQARASALVLALAPVVFALLAAATDPRYVPFLTGTVPGAVLLHAGLALDAAGLAWMTRLIRTSGAGGGR